MIHKTLKLNIFCYNDNMISVVETVSATTYESYKHNNLTFQRLVHITFVAPIETISNICTFTFLRSII